MTEEFAVPKFTGLDATLGAPLKSYLTAEQMGRDFYADRNRYTRVASALFFNGGKLADHGMQFKAGIDKGAAMTAIRAWLCSFEPAHEIKIGTVGYALSKWCEDYAPPKTADQTARTEARERKAKAARSRKIKRNHSGAAA